MKYLENVVVNMSHFGHLVFLNIHESSKVP
jgi:hypothetical protein